MEELKQITDRLDAMERELSEIRAFVERGAGVRPWQVAAMLGLTAVIAVATTAAAVTLSIASPIVVGSISDVYSLLTEAYEQGR